MAKRQRRNVSCDECNEGFSRSMPLSDFLSVVCDRGGENGDDLASFALDRCEASTQEV
jgi:hypothetical protein